jgi:hypothetical protein
MKTISALGQELIILTMFYVGLLSPIWKILGHYLKLDHNSCFFWNHTIYNLLITFQSKLFIIWATKSVVEYASNVG